MMLKKVIRLNADDFLLYLGAEGGIFLLLQIIICCVMYFVQPNGVMVSGALLPVVGGFLVLLAAIAHVTILFNQALRFGQTRRRAVRVIVGLALVQGIFAMGLAALLSAVERYLCPWLWAALAGKACWAVEPVGDWSSLQDCLVIGSFNLDWWWYPVILAVGVGGGIVLGALFYRFGNRAAWVLWGIFIALMLTAECVDGSILPIAPWSPYMIAVAVVLAMAGMVWAVWSLLHSVVK